MEYLEDAFPDTKHLMPELALGKAAVRNSLQRLDTALHLHIATISIGIAFRDQLLAVLNNDQALKSFYSATPDPRLQAAYRDVVPVMTRAEHLRASGLSATDVGVLLDAVAEVAEPVRLTYLWRPALADVDDDMVLEAAVNVRADAIVTFNLRDFVSAAAYFGIAVMSSGEAVKRLEKRQ